MCRHCHEQFPFITQDELEAHEHSHRTCPFCMLVCDHMEQSMYEDHVYSHELWEQPQGFSFTVYDKGIFGKMLM